MKLLVLCVMAHSLSTITGLDLFDWNQQVAKPKFLMDRGKYISDNWNAISYKDKHSFLSQGFDRRIKSSGVEGHNLRPRLVTRSLECSCETQYKIKDLGEGHYPRYLTTSFCTTKACHNNFNSCRLLQYVVYVLSQRNANESSYNSDDVENLEAPLPEALRHNWKLKPTRIPVACVPATG